ncbi:hypothetical protein MRX96_024144 [Rhipicephalus microplus]
MHPETYPADKCKVCHRETADYTSILCECIKHPEESDSRTIPLRLEVAAKSYDQEEQPRTIQQVLAKLERQWTKRARNGDRRPVSSNGSIEDDTLNSGIRINWRLTLFLDWRLGYQSLASAPLCRISW